MEQTVSKSKFKPQALKYFRRVEESGESLVITDRGKPVLKILPYSQQPLKGTWRPHRFGCKIRKTSEPVGLRKIGSISNDCPGHARLDLVGE